MFLGRTWSFLTLILVLSGTYSAVVPTPLITPAPTLPSRALGNEGIEAWEKRQDPDVVSLARVLLTALPLSLRQMAVTNAPAVSTILSEDISSTSLPQWFLDLPSNIQSYLIREFGPQTTMSTSAQSIPYYASEISATTTEDVGASSFSASSISLFATEATSVFDTIGSTGTPVLSTNQPATTGAASFGDSSTSLSLRSTVRISMTSSNVGRQSDAPAASSSDLSTNQKIGLGIGIPLGLFAAAGLIFGCCLLFRRRRRHVNGTERPSSPGFIPHFAFHDKSSDYFTPYRALSDPPSRDVAYSPSCAATRNHRSGPSSKDRHASGSSGSSTISDLSHTPPLAALALPYSHSSNRARGTRTSYTSLHSVAEMPEPNDASPLNGPEQNGIGGRKRSSGVIPIAMDFPPIPAAATVKRKPLSTPTSPVEGSTACNTTASNQTPSVLQPGRGFARRSLPLLATSPLLNSTPDQQARDSSSTDIASPISPLSDCAPSSPLSQGLPRSTVYYEDYRPEYAGSNHSPHAKGYQTLGEQWNGRTGWPLSGVGRAY